MQFAKCVERISAISAAEESLGRKENAKQPEWWSQDLKSLIENKKLTRHCYFDSTVKK